MTGERPQRGLLDTNILILRRWVDPAELPAEMAISAITLAELSAGPHEVRGNDEQNLYDEREERARRMNVRQRAESESDSVRRGGGSDLWSGVGRDHRDRPQAETEGGGPDDRIDRRCGRSTPLHHESGRLPWARSSPDGRARESTACSTRAIATQHRFGRRHARVAGVEWSLALDASAPLSGLGELEKVVGRGGLEPPASAVFGPER